MVEIAGEAFFIGLFIMLTQERLKELLDYDSTTGNFTRKSSRYGYCKGEIAGSIDKLGYVRIQVDGMLCLAHRLVWFYVYGVWPKKYIDHINHNPTDNRITNLREATQAENMQNQVYAKKCSITGFLGVSPNGNGFMARIKLSGSGIHKYLGTFKTPEQAHEAYLAAKREYHSFGIL